MNSHQRRIFKAKVIRTYPIGTVVRVWGKEAVIDSLDPQGIRSNLCKIRWEPREGSKPWLTEPQTQWVPLSQIQFLKPSTATGE